MGVLSTNFNRRGCENKIVNSDTKSAMGENRRLQSLLLRRTQSHRATLSSLSSALSSAEKLVEAYFHNHPITPAVRNQEPPPPVDDRDSFSSVQAVINSESQMDRAVEIDSMVSLSTSSSRRRNEASGVSDMDSGDSRAFFDTGEIRRLQSSLLRRTQSHRATFSSLSSALSSAEKLVEAYFHKYPITPAVRNQEPPPPVDDRDSFSSIQAVINSESQMDTAVEIDSMVSLSTSSSRRRTEASRVSDMDSGDSRAPRRRRLNCKPLLQLVSTMLYCSGVRNDTDLMRPGPNHDNDMENPHTSHHLVCSCYWKCGAPLFKFCSLQVYRRWISSSHLCHDIDDYHVGRYGAMCIEESTTMRWITKFLLKISRRLLKPKAYIVCVALPCSTLNLFMASHPSSITV